MNSEFIAAIDMLEKERKISKDVLFEAIEAALISAFKKDFGSEGEIRVHMDRETGAVSVVASKKVVDEITNKDLELSLAQAKSINAKYKLGDVVEVEVTPKQFGRIAAQTAKQVIVQRLREAERGMIYDQILEKENEISTASVSRVEKKNVFVELENAEGYLPPSEQMPGEPYNQNDRIKVYIIEAKRTTRGPQVLVSRTHPGLVKRLFELEVPEIQTGVVQIRSIAREAGYRTKMAVYSEDESVDPLGACVGQKGIRVARVVQELRDEKIDIIKWSNDPVEYIANALSPAKVLMVRANEDERMAQVIVPDGQLSLAIGREGQNARLAAKLTGWKIDIKSQSQMTELFNQDQDDAYENDDPQIDQAELFEQDMVEEDAE